MSPPLSPTERIAQIAEKTFRKDRVFTERLNRAAELSSESARLVDLAGLTDSIRDRVSGLMWEMGQGIFGQFALDPDIQRIVAGAREPLVPQTIARGVAADAIIAPRLRLATLSWLGDHLAHACRPEAETGRVAVGPAWLTGRTARMGVRVARKHYELSIDVADRLMLDDAGRKTELRDLGWLMDALQPLRTPGESFARLRAVAELLAGRDRWTSQTESAVRAMLRTYVTEDNRAKEYDRLDEWSLSRSVGIKRGVKPSILSGLDTDIALADVYQQMRMAASVSTDPDTEMDILSEFHPLRATSDEEFRKFVELDSRLLWAKSKILEPFVAVMLESSTIHKDAKAHDHLMGIIEEHGMKYVAERFSNEPWFAKFIRRSARYLELEHKEVTGIAKLGPERHIELGKIVHAIFDQFDTKHWPERERYASCAEMRGVLEKPERAYAERLVSDPIDRAADDIVAEAWDYFANLYETHPAAGAIEENGVIRVPDAKYSRAVVFADGSTQAASALIRASQASPEESIWKPSIPTDPRGFGRLGMADFCLVMFAQAFSETNISPERWQSLKRRVENLSGQRENMGGIELLDRDGLPKKIGFANAPFKGRPKRRN